MTTMRVLILGGTGTISAWIVHHLLAMGRQVTVVNRGRGLPAPTGVEELQADRHDPASLSAVLAGRSFDVTIDMLCFTAEQAQMLVETFPRHGHLVFCSTVCALGFGWSAFPVDESATPQPTSPYGVAKAAAEAWFTAYAQRSGTPLTIVRPSTTFDERIGLLRQVRWDGSAWLGRIRAGLPLILCDSGMAIHQFMHADDAGRGFALIAGHPTAPGRIYHLVGPAVTWATHHDTAMRILGRTVPLLGIPAAVLDRSQIPDDGIRREIFGLHGHFASARIRTEIGFEPRHSLPETLAKVITGLDAARKIPSAVTAGGWEDELITRWG